MFESMSVRRLASCGTTGARYFKDDARYSNSATAIERIINDQRYD